MYCTTSTNCVYCATNKLYVLNYKQTLCTVQQTQTVYTLKKETVCTVQHAQSLCTVQKSQIVCTVHQKTVCTVQ